MSMKINTNSLFFYNAHDLPRRAGEMREAALELKLLDNLGIPMLSVPSGSCVSLGLRLESVDEGILATGQVHAVAIGECTRCLDSITFPINQMFQELFEYESKPDRKQKSKATDTDDLDVDDAFFLVGDFLNLETPIRDAIVLALPINPLCDEDCAGLCVTCGEKWESLPDNHEHEVIDARWTGLANWDGSNGKIPEVTEK